MTNDQATYGALGSRADPRDPANTLLSPGQEPTENPFGMRRRIQDAQASMADQLSQLETEKISLMKRLNMVLSELERATHEKSDVAQRLREQERLAEDLKRKLDEVSSLKTVVNRNLQGDLKYEIDLNKKLRDELDRFEKEKDSLVQKLRIEEGLSTQIQGETDQVNSDLIRKTDDLQRLEMDHETTQRRLRDLNSQLDHLRQNEIKNRQHKVSLDEQTRELTDQRNDLVRRLNDLSTKYEDYVAQMNRERIDLQSSNKHHVKALVSKLLFQILEENLTRKKKNALQEINSTAKQMVNLETKLNKMQRILGKYIENRKRAQLRIWYRKALNVVHENYKRNSLIDGNVAHRLSQKYYFLWRQLYLNRKRIFANKIASCKLIDRLTTRNSELLQRHYLCRWRDYTERRQAQDDFLLSICFRRRQRDLRQRFIDWLGFVKREKMAEKQEVLSEIVTITCFKQRVFLGLKHAVQQSKAEMGERRFQAWKNWCEASRKKKFFEKKEIMVENLEGIKAERLLKACFDAIRFGNTQHKFETTRAILEQKIPEREELEYKLECLERQTATKTKYHALRQCYLRHCDVKFRALTLWKEYSKHYAHVMNRIKLRLIEKHNQRRLWAFMKLRENADKNVLIQLKVETEECLNMNQDAKNDLSRNKDMRKRQEDQSSRMQVSKLERVRNLFNRKSMRNFFQKWVNGALKAQALDQALEKLKKTGHKRRMRLWFARLRSQTKSKRRGEHIVARCDWLNLVRAQATSKDVFAAWKERVRIFKLARAFMKRALHGMDRNSVDSAFRKWKDVCAETVMIAYEEDKAQLESHIDEQKVEISRKRDQIDACESKKQHIISQSKSLSKKVLANYLTRMTLNKQGRGFYIWLEEARNFNQKKRILRKILVFQTKNQLNQAFRTWSENFYLEQQEELATELANKENQKRDMIRAYQDAKDQDTDQVERLQEELAASKAARDQAKANFKQAFATFKNRKAGNYYVPKRENIFREWAYFIKKEKNAVNVIGAIARQTLRREVFQRIRLFAREKYLDNTAIKVCEKFFNHTRDNILRRAVLRWRENAKQAVMVQLCQTTELMQEQALQQGQEMERVNKQRERVSDQSSRREKLRKTNDAMREMLNVLKALRVKQEVLKQNVAFLKAKRATQKWFHRTQLTLYLRRRNDQVIQKYKLNRMSRVFNALKQKLNDEKLGAKMMSRLLNRMQYFDQAHAFQHWQQITRSLHERDHENRQHGYSNMTLILRRLVKRRLAQAMHQMRLRTEKKDFKEKFLRRMLTHVADYRRRHYFEKWRQFVKCTEIAETVNTEGDVVMRRNQLARQAAQMKKKLVELGYTPEQIEEYLETKASKQRAEMQRGIIAMFFKNSDFQVVPKAFNQLKAYVQARKQARKNAIKVLNWIHHPLAIYFRKWKYEMGDAEKKLEDLSKQELIDKIIADENLIGSTESRLDRMGNTIDTLAFQRENLFGHFLRSQKLAVALMKNNYLKTVWRAMQRWKRVAADGENMALVEQLENTNGMLRALREHVGKLEGINRNLLAENEELRQAALDGIEISNVVQELTRERETLSQDLQDRAGTIKRLIEDNNNLAIRLNIAQNEAQQLEMINSQVYAGPPERDF